MTDSRLVLVQFVDVVGRSEWASPSDHLGHLCVGWLLRDNEDGIVLAGTRAEDWRHTNDMSFIPRSAIRSIVDLKVVK